MATALQARILGLTPPTRVTFERSLLDSNTIGVKKSSGVNPPVYFSCQMVQKKDFLESRPDTRQVIELNDERFERNLHLQMVDSRNPVTVVHETAKDWFFESSPYSRKPNQVFIVSKEELPPEKLETMLRKSICLLPSHIDVNIDYEDFETLYLDIVERIQEIVSRKVVSVDVQSLQRSCNFEEVRRRAREELTMQGITLEPQAEINDDLSLPTDSFYKGKFIIETTFTETSSWENAFFRCLDNPSFDGLDLALPPKANVFRSMKTRIDPKYELKDQSTRALLSPEHWQSIAETFAKIESPPPLNLNPVVPPPTVDEGVVRAEESPGSEMFFTPRNSPGSESSSSRTPTPSLDPLPQASKSEECILL